VVRKIFFFQLRVQAASYFKVSSSISLIITNMIFLFSYETGQFSLMW